MVMIVNRPSGWEPFAEGLGSAVNTFAKQKSTENALSTLLKDNAKARAVALLPEHLQEPYLKTLMSQTANTDWEARHGIGQPAPQPISQVASQQEQQIMPQLGSIQQLMGDNNWMQQPQQSPIQQLLNPIQQQQPMQPQQQMPQPNFGIQQQAPEMAPQQGRRIQDLNADELSAALTDAPEQVRKQWAPRLSYLTAQEAAERNVTKAEAKEQVDNQKTLNKDAHELYNKVLKPDSQQAAVFLKNLQHAEKLMKANPEYFGSKWGSYQNMLPQDLRDKKAQPIASAFANIELDKLGTIKGIKNVATLYKIGEGKPRLGQDMEENQKFIDDMRAFAVSNREALKDFNEIVPDLTKVSPDFQQKLDARAEARVNKILGIESQGSSPEGMTQQAVSPEVLSQLPDPSNYQEGKILRHPETKEGFKKVNGQWEGGY